MQVEAYLLRLSKCLSPKNDSKQYKLESSKKIRCIWCTCRFLYNRYVNDYRPLFLNGICNNITFSLKKSLIYLSNKAGHQMPCFILVSITLYKIFISALISDKRSSFDMMLDIKFLLHGLIAVYLACFLTT